MLVGASLALGACTRERRSDRDRNAAHPSPTEQPSGPTITVVPASEELISRASAGGTTIRAVLAAAKPTIGTPYEWSGASLTGGIDCSHYTWLLYRSIGVPYGRYMRTREMATLRRHAGFTQTTLAEAQPGDLLVYGYRDDDGTWHGHVVILVDKTGRITGHQGLVLGAHGTPVSAVQFVVADGFDQGWFKTPEMRFLNALRPSVPDVE